METYHRDRYMTSGINRVFVQDKPFLFHARHRQGLHYQIRNSQAKLVQVISGEIFDVAVDIRPDSPTFGKWTGFRLSGQNRRQLFIPEGFAHGFCVLSEIAYFLYKCSDFFAPDDEGEFSGPILTSVLTGRLNIRSFLKGQTVSLPGQNWPWMSFLLYKNRLTLTLQKSEGFRAKTARVKPY